MAELFRNFFPSQSVFLILITFDANQLKIDQSDQTEIGFIRYDSD